jgi:hypothetical protein
MEEEIVSSSQTETAPETQEEVFADPREAFGLPQKEEASTDAEHDEEGRSVNDPPATEEKPAEPKLFKVKHNKDEVEVDISTDEKLTDHLQRSLALDKERERAKQSQNDLDRAAKLLGYKDHAELTANLDRIEKEHQQQAQDQFEQAKQSIIDQLVYNGVDEQAAREYAENNPLVKQAKAAMEKEQAQEVQRQQRTAEQQRLSSWDELYKAFPDLVDDSKKFSEGGRADFYTPEMERMYMAGYKPLDAYKLAHMDKIQTQTKKQTEQKVIKQQLLGQRSQVEGTSPVDTTPAVDPALKSAFSAFGLDPSRANKYAKKAR